MDSYSSIVVINDDEVQLELYTLWLRNAGYTIMRFNSSEKALVYLHETEIPPALILTDLYMPGIDGWKLCRLLRSKEYLRYRDVPILVISATFAGADAQEISRDIGANFFLSAPVKREKLISTVESVLQGDKISPSSYVLVVEDSSLQCEIVEKAFTKKGFIVVTAENAVTARESFYRYIPEVVILDYHLPDIKGDDLLEEFRRALPHTVLIMMTTDPNPLLAVEWMRKGAAAYIKKPFDPTYLVTLCVKAIKERKLLYVEQLLETRTKQLKESSERMGKVLSTMEIGLIIHNPDKTVDWVNGFMRRSFPKENPEGKICYRFFEGRNTPCEQCAVEECFKTEKISETVSHNKKDHRWYHSIAHPLFNEEGTVAQVLETVSDITKQKKSEEFLRQVFEAIVHPLYVVRVDDYSLEMTNTAARNLGEGTTCYELTHNRNTPCEGKEYSCPIEEIRRTGKSTSLIHTHSNEGVPLLVEIHAFPIFNENGKLDRVIEYSMDVTEREEAKKRQEQALKEKEILLKEVHHRVKNNLSVVVALLSLQSSEIDNEDVKSYFHEAMGRIESMALVHDKLYKSNDLSGVDIGNYLDDIVGQLIDTYRGTNPPIEYSVDSPHYHIDLDTAVPLGLIINELVTNSLKYGFSNSSNGKISISLEKKGSNFHLSISDNGSGFEKDQIESTSLGLVLVKILSEQIDATYSIDSTPKGTVSTLNFSV